MFGYIKLDSNAPRAENAVFKKNYCMLCKAIEKNYGQFPRFLLSFDVTFLLLMFTNSNVLEDIKKVKCLTANKDVKRLSKQEVLKKCAALNIAMAEAEVLDHINDDKSLLAKTALTIFKRPFNRVKKDYPTMHERLIKGYAKFDEYEKDNRSLDDIEDMFSDLILGIAKEEFGLEDQSLINELSYVAKWLYFIDAADDLDKDIKSNSFNPLKGQFKSCDELFNKNYKWFEQHIDKLRNGIKPVLSEDINRKTVTRIVFCGISESTAKVMLRRK